MITPTVTEIHRTLNAVGHDTFIDGYRPRVAQPTTVAAHADAPRRADSRVSRAPFAARPAASGVTFPRAA